MDTSSQKNTNGRSEKFGGKKNPQTSKGGVGSRKRNMGRGAEGGWEIGQNPPPLLPLCGGPFTARKRWSARVRMDGGLEARECHSLKGWSNGHRDATMANSNEPGRIANHSGPPSLVFHCSATAPQPLAPPGRESHSLQRGFSVRIFLLTLTHRDGFE